MAEAACSNPSSARQPAGNHDNRLWENNRRRSEAIDDHQSALVSIKFCSAFTFGVKYTIRVNVLLCVLVTSVLICVSECVGSV